MEYTFDELAKEMRWENVPTYSRGKQRAIEYAKNRGVVIEVAGRDKNNHILYKIISKEDVYTKQEIIKKYDLKMTEARCNQCSATEFILFCKKRGLTIEKYGYIGQKSAFKIIADERTLEDEIWKIIPGLTMYASNLGRIKNATGQIKSQRLIDGYYYVTDGIAKKTFRVHRLVMQAFAPIENNDEFDVDHIDGVKTNNNINNLRWVSTRENINARDDNNGKIGLLISELIQKYGYSSVYNYLLAFDGGNGE